MTHTEFQELLLSLVRSSDDSRIEKLSEGYDQLYAEFAITEQTMTGLKTYTDIQNFAFHHGVELDSEDRSDLEEALVDHFNDSTTMKALAYHSLTDETGRYDDEVDAFMCGHKKKLCCKFVDAAFAIIHSDDR